MNHGMNNKHYKHFSIMIILHFIAMYIFMYAMVNSLDNVFNNLNQVYMAGLMTASMILIEIPIMRTMYPDKKRNVIIIGFGLAALVLCFLFIRDQSAISDKQFLKSMIPHHAGAILMCEQASIKDPEILKLCAAIDSSQRAEINQMKEILNRIDK